MRGLLTNRRLHRRTNLKQRLRENVPHGRQHCWVLDCRMPPGNASGNGLGRFCKRHLEHFRRHGDPLKGSYRAAEIAPHRKAATAWIKQHSKDAFVVGALNALQTITRGAGRAIEPNQLRGRSPQEKANAVWARIRDKGRKPEIILSAILAVAMRYEADQQKAKLEHRRVQIGKALNRLGGGRVKRWNVEHPKSVNGVLTLRWFPSSEGLVLRELGGRAENATEFLIHERIKELLQFSAEYREKNSHSPLPFETRQDDQ